MKQDQPSKSGEILHRIVDVFTICLYIAVMVTCLYLVIAKGMFLLLVPAFIVAVALFAYLLDSIKD